mmetsp:Transcript_36285/g.104242  ORF Transcript_36285/g.104242 Transcript_36285/m.104242 type:complete len:279 (-) Transcript_36285:102-938(-)
MHDPELRDVGLLDLLVSHLAAIGGHPVALKSVELLLRQVVGEAMRLPRAPRSGRQRPWRLGAVRGHDVELVFVDEAHEEAVLADARVENGPRTQRRRLRIEELPHGRIRRDVLADEERPAHGHEDPALGALLARHREVGHAGVHDARPLPPQLLLQAQVFLLARARGRARQVDRLAGGHIRGIQLSREAAVLRAPQVQHLRAVRQEGGLADARAARPGQLGDLLKTQRLLLPLRLPLRHHDRRCRTSSCSRSGNAGRASNGTIGGEPGAAEPWARWLP